MDVAPAAMSAAPPSVAAPGATRCGDNALANLTVEVGHLPELLTGADLPDVVADEEGNRRMDAGERVKGLSACDVACPKRALPLIADSKYRGQLVFRLPTHTSKA